MSRVLFWVQHLLGRGHLSRALTLARALAGHGFEVTLASGGGEEGALGAPGVRLVPLPAIRAADADFSGLVDGAGRPVDEALWTARRRRLLDLFETLRPGVVLTEMFPFGRRAFRAEVLPLLEAAGDLGALRVASVRDVLVDKGSADRYRWMREVAVRHYDLILAHTDPTLIPFGLTFPFRDDLGERLIETGFIGPEPAAPGSAVGTGEVLVSAGGGRVGRALLEAALAARPLLGATADWRLIARDDEEAQDLARRAGPGLIVDRHRPDFRDLLANSLLSVSQAGYNTVVEALSFEKRMVLVPFETAGETEQRTRAAELARRGLALMVPGREPAPEALARAVAACAGAAPSVRPRIDLGGAARSARLIAERIGARARR